MWTDAMFGVKKPIIALLHLRALVGDPMYEGSMDEVLTQARKDLRALQDGGVDGVLIANEFSLPYEPKASYVTVAAMSYLVGQLRVDIKVPFGVNVVLNPLASLEMAAATGANFIRSAFTGAYMGENGITTTDVAATVRKQHELGMKDLKLLYKVNPESDTYLAPRDLQTIVKSIIFHCAPDGLCVSGASAGSETDTGIVEEVKAVSGGVPVFCNTGCSAATIEDKLRFADGACVGTTFKVDGKFENNVDPKRVVEFMDVVRRVRAGLA